MRIYYYIVRAPVCFVFIYIQTHDFLNINLFLTQKSIRKDKGMLQVLYRNKKSNRERENYCSVSSNCLSPNTHPNNINSSFNFFMLEN